MPKSAPAALRWWPPLATSRPLELVALARGRVDIAQLGRVGEAASVLELEDEIGERGEGDASAG